MSLQRLCYCITSGMALMLPAVARAEEEGTSPPPPVELSFVYTADIAATVSGGADSKARYLDNFDLIADADLDRLIGWKGARAHVYGLGNFGKRPNDSAGTLEGVDNIEVSRQPSTCSRHGLSRISAVRACSRAFTISTASFTPANHPAC